MKEFLSPIGMLVRVVDDVVIISQSKSGPPSYMGLGQPQYLQHFRTTTAPVQAREIAERGPDIFEGRILEALATHLDKIGLALMWGQPYEELVDIADSEHTMTVRMTGGLKYFIRVNEKLRGKWPGVMLLRGLGCKLLGPFEDIFTGTQRFHWKSEIGLGWTHDGGTWEGKFERRLWMDEIARVMTRLKGTWVTPS